MNKTMLKEILYTVSNEVKKLLILYNNTYNNITTAPTKKEALNMLKQPMIYRYFVEYIDSNSLVDVLEETHQFSKQDKEEINILMNILKFDDSILLAIVNQFYN